MKKWIEDTDIRQITFNLLVIGLGIFFVIGSIGAAIFDGNPPKIFLVCLGLIVTVIGIIPGYAAIIKREAPGGRGKITGKAAVISGWIWVIFLSSMLFGLIIASIFDI